MTETLARTCADDAADEAGSGEAGARQMEGAKPLPGDWEALGGLVGREPTNDECETFEETYEERADWRNQIARRETPAWAIARLADEMGGASVLADVLEVSTRAVEYWAAGERSPGGPAKAMMRRLAEDI
jgi:hypothetical protein